MAQNIENKKTTLSDDASIYRKKEDRESSETMKNNWSNLHGKDKRKYFKDYMLLPLLGGIAAVIVVFLFVKTLLSGKPATMYCVAVMSEKYVDADKVQEHVDNMAEAFKLLESEKIELELGLGKSSTSGQSEFLTELMAGSLDMIIGTEKDLEDMAAHFMTFDEVNGADELVPKDARVSLTHDLTDDGTGKPGYETVECGIKLEETVLKDCIPEGSRYADSLIVVFVKSAHNSGDLSKYWDALLYVMGV